MHVSPKSSSISSDISCTRGLVSLSELQESPGIASSSIKAFLVSLYLVLLGFFSVVILGAGLLLYGDGITT